MTPSLLPTATLVLSRELADNLGDLGVLAVQINCGAAEDEDEDEDER
jgi:hypothetical protein